MFRQAIITVTSIPVRLCPAAWAEQALFAPDMGAGGCAQDRGAEFGVWAVTAGLQRGDVTAAVDLRRKTVCSFLDPFPEVLLPP